MLQLAGVEGKKELYLLTSKVYMFKVQILQQFLLPDTHILRN